MPICETCSQIFQGPRQRKLPIGREFRSVFKPPTHESATRGEHHKDFAALKTSAGSGCHLCIIVLASRPLCCTAVSESHIKGPIWYDFIRPNDLWLNKKGWIELHFHVGDLIFKETKVATLVPIKSMNQDIIMPPIYSENTGSEESWNPALNSYLRCIHKHSRCREENSRSGWNPTRVIDVGTVDYPVLRLCDTLHSDVALAYTTLSHCWGDLKIHKLVDSNIDALMVSIDPSQLTKTFQDAVRITRLLRVQYLWIDSLCIIQGSKKDWDIESLLMGRVYQHGICNIAATSASNGSVGCFFNKNPLLVQPLMVHATWPKVGEREWWDPSAYNHEEAIVTSKLFGGDFFVDRGGWETVVEEGPLNQRAWVVQERLLAPRTLHFTTEQIYWECRTSTASEAFASRVSGTAGTKIAEVKDAVSETSESQTTSGKLMKWMKEKVENRHSTARDFRVWNQLVMAYTKGNLTQERDKMIAISGLADIFQGKADDEYLAGLWRRALPYQLLWFVENPNLSTRPKDYRAPSWSWASVNGAVGYHEFEDVHKDDICVDILAASVSSPSPRGLGQIESGYVLLRGQLAAGFLKANGAKLELHLYLSKGKTGLMDTSLALDISSEGLGLTEVICLLVYRKFVWQTAQGSAIYEKSDREILQPKLRGLILSPRTAERDEFTRLGFFKGDTDYTEPDFASACKAFDKKYEGQGWDIEKVKKKTLYKIRLI
ncbi:hypothetical protein VTL71DRAFT_2132 [Oculimacula yallundae]|uniref:Heterokaryon incompatibility domain-containing protein n=1 Tax=Oculimacula yallundae TaxID=86028 RepID=A0ABR4C9X9_9HELO